MTILPADGVAFEFHVPVLIIGAGACGLVAALAAAEMGAAPLVLERDKSPRGSTALSGGMVPAVGSHLQRSQGIVDSVETYLADIVRKTRGRTDMVLARHLVERSGALIDWMQDGLGIELELCRGLRYPGHSAERMHSPPGRTGAVLHGALLSVVAARGIELLTQAPVIALYADASRRIRGVRVTRPDGAEEMLGCEALVLACNGFGANREMIARYIPALHDAPYFGHPGNLGDAVLWGMELGAAVADMGSFQGHGAIGDPSGIPMWQTLTVNGIQVNLEGRRFADETAGYSEHALKVLAQPQGLAWNIFDRRGFEIGMTHAEFREGVPLGVVKQAPDAAALAEVTGLPATALAASIAEAQAMARGKKSCPFGRDFTRGPPLEPPYYAARVTGAYLHTQGGLVVDCSARVLGTDGAPLPNLFAGGGAARGISGPSDWGYLSGNGLLTAVALGRIAGTAATHLARVQS
jgi:fumarate reductase flavoprotein subunit